MNLRDVNQDKLQKEKLLSILIELKKLILPENEYTAEEVLTAFEQAKQSIFPDEIINEDTNTEITRLKLLVDQQLCATTLSQKKKKLNAIEITQIIHRSGFLFASNTTEEEIKISFLKAIQNNISSEAIIEEAISDWQSISKQNTNLTLKDIAAFFNENGELKAELFDYETGKLRQDVNLNEISEAIRNNVLIDPRLKSSVYRPRKINDMSPISRQDIIINSVLDASYADVYRILPTLSVEYSNKVSFLGKKITEEQTFYTTITGANFLEDFCVSAFNNLTYGSPMVLKDSVNGYDFNKGFKESLRLSIEGAFELPSTAKVITREELIERFPDANQVENNSLSEAVNSDFIVYGEGGVVQIKKDCCERRAVLAMGNENLGYPDEGNEAIRQLELDTVKSRLSAVIGDEVSAINIINAVSQGPIGYISMFAMNAMPAPNEEIQLIVPRQARIAPAIIVGSKIPAKPKLDTYYLIDTQDGWKLTYLDFYGKQEDIVLSKVDGLVNFLNNKNSSSFSDKDTLRQLEILITPYRNLIHLAPLQRFNYVKDKKSGELYLICDSKLFGIINMENKNLNGSIGSYNARFRYKDRGELKCIIKQDTGEEINADNIEPNTYVFCRDAENNWRCTFIDVNKTVKNVNIDKLPYIVAKNLENITQDHDLNNISQEGYARVLMSNKEPDLKGIRPNTLVMVLEDQMLTAYWLENGKIVNKSFQESQLQEIVNALPLKNTSSNDKKLIKAITLQYGCAPQETFKLFNASLNQMRHGFELVDITTNDPYTIQALHGKKFSNEEVKKYSDFNSACHILQEEIKEKRASKAATPRVLIHAETTLHQIRKECCNDALNAENLTRLTTRLEESINEVRKPSSLISDAIAKLKMLDHTPMHHQHGGIKKLVKYSNKNLSNEDKWNKIVKECEHRSSWTSSVGGLLKHSLLHKLSPRSDEADLIYRAILENKKNLTFNYNIQSFEQLLIAQQKRDAIKIFEDEISRLNTPAVYTGAFGGNGVLPVSSLAKLKIRGYLQLINEIKKSSHTISLSDVLKSIFDTNDGNYKITYKGRSDDNAVVDKEMTIKACLEMNRGLGVTMATSAKVIAELRQNTIDPHQLIQNIPNQNAIQQRI